MEIKFSSKIHVSRIDTMKVENSQNGSVCGCPNNILGNAAGTLAIRRSLLELRCSASVLHRETTYCIVFDIWHNSSAFASVFRLDMLVDLYVII